MPTSMPLVSVIMTAYNAALYIDQAIESIIKQTFKNWELIVVDDGSKDKTLKIIKNYTKQDPRIKLIINDKNIGQALARNQALKIARGKYVAVLDADDYAYPQRLAKQSAFLNKYPGLTLVGSAATLIDKNGKKIGSKNKPSNPEIIAYKMLIQNQFIHSTMMYKLRDILAIGMYRHEFQHAEDYDLCARLLTAKYRLTNLPEQLVAHRIHPTSMTQSPVSQPNQAKRAITVNQRLITPYYKCSRQQMTDLSKTINHSHAALLTIIKSLYLFKQITNSYIKKNNLPEEKKDKILSAYKILTRRSLARLGERIFPLGILILRKILKFIKTKQLSNNLL